MPAAARPRRDGTPDVEKHSPVSTEQLPAADELASGALVLSRYRLQRTLGTGGFATVWAARDERLERDVAVKVLQRERVVFARFEREARTAARLMHPAIVTFYEAAIDDDRWLPRLRAGSRANAGEAARDGPSVGP